MTGDIAVRRCSLPACPSWYDTIAVMDGQATATGWLHWNALGLRLCPDHAGPWTRTGRKRAPHEPKLIQDGGVTWLRCSCGWVLDTAGLTAGESGNRYVDHLIDIVAVEAPS